MAKRRSLAELRRQLKRRLRGTDPDVVMRVCRDLREFAVAHKFYDGYSTAYMAESEYITRAMSRDDIERAVRSHGLLR